MQRRYGPPLTPLDRLIAKNLIDAQTAAKLLAQRAALGPFALVATVREKVAAILAAPLKPVEKRRGRPPASPAFTKAGLERNTRLEEAPVRSYVAR